MHIEFTVTLLVIIDYILISIYFQELGLKLRQFEILALNDNIVLSVQMETSGMLNSENLNFSTVHSRKFKSSEFLLDDKNATYLSSSTISTLTTINVLLVSICCPHTMLLYDPRISNVLSLTFFNFI